MEKSVGLVFVIFLLFPFVMSAQATSIPMLGFNPDPQSFGLGMSGVSNSTNDPLGFYYNPAILGYSAQSNSLAYQFYPGKVDYYGLGGYEYNSQGFTAGYNFSKLLKGLNLSAGVGFISSKFDLKTVYHAVDNTVLTDPYDKYNAYGIGVSLDYFVNLSFGLTVKNMVSQIPAYYMFMGYAYTRKINVLDWGILLNIPISKLGFYDYSYNISDNASIKPIANFSIGYSRSNIGTDDGGYPLPLTGRLGYTLSPGADLVINNHSINLFTYDITVEAEDILVSRNASGNYDYHGLLGDIKFGRNLIEWKGSEGVTLKKAQKVDLFETVSFLFGSFYRGVPNLDLNNLTNGFILSTNGLFKFLSWNVTPGHPWTNFFLDHFEIKYVNSTWINKIGFSSDFTFEEKSVVKGISISFNRFMF